MADRHRRATSRTGTRRRRWRLGHRRTGSDRRGAGIAALAAVRRARSRRSASRRAAAPVCVALAAMTADAVQGSGARPGSAECVLLAADRHVAFVSAARRATARRCVERGGGMIAEHARSRSRRCRRAPFDLRAFDGLRGLAALYIVAHHARIDLWEGSHRALASGGFAAVLAFATVPLRYGAEVVLLFFLLSGFVIHLRQAQSLARRRASELPDDRLSSGDARRGLCRRCSSRWCSPPGSMPPGRAPTHRCTTAYADGRSAFVFAMNALFLQGFAAPTFGSNSALWSLAYEAIFYAMLPVAGCWLACGSERALRSVRLSRSARAAWRCTWHRRRSAGRSRRTSACGCWARWSRRHSRTVFRFVRPWCC